MALWKRNLYVLFVVQLLSMAGFSLVFPFLPLYVKELGVATRGSVEFWSGMAYATQAAVMMVAAPIWGAYADRYGRKVMLVRATIGGGILILLMGLVQNAEQLVVLRTIQGAVSGVISAASALVAASTPKERTGEAMGLLQTSRWAGLAIGPFVGGLLGDAFGFRESFWITGTMLGIAGFATLFLVHEHFVPAPTKERPSMVRSYRELLRAPGLSGLYELTFLRSLGQTMVTPVMALFVVELMGSEDSAASVTGLVFGAAAVTSSVSSIWFGQLGDRWGHKRLLILAAIAAMILYMPQPFVTATWQLVVLQGLTGVATGAMLPTISALMNVWSPDGNQGAIYGLDTSVNAAARSVAPLFGAAIANWLDLRGVFGATALVYAVIALLTVQILRNVDSAKAVLKGASD